MIEHGAKLADNTPTSGSIISALLTCGAFTTIGLFSPALVLPKIAAYFAAVPNATLLTGLVGTLASFSFALAAPWAGRIIARHGCRAVIVPALATFAVSGALPAVVDDLWVILAARAILGISLAGIFTGALSGIASLAGPIRSRMFGWFSVVGGGTAIALFPAIGLLGQAGWRPAFAVNLLALPVIALASRLPTGMGRTAQREEHAAGVRVPLFNAPLLGLLVIAVITGLAMLVAPVCTPLVLAGLGVNDTRLLAIPATIGSITAVFASGIYGWMHQKIGSRGITALSMLVTAGALTIAGLTSHVVLFSAMVIVTNAMVALMAPNLSASAFATVGPIRGAEAMGLANACMFGAQLAFPFIEAAMRNHGGIRGLFLALALPALVAGAVHIRMWRCSTT